MQPCQILHVAAALHINKPWVLKFYLTTAGCRRPLHCRTVKLYPSILQDAKVLPFPPITAGRWSSMSLLQEDEVLPPYWGWPSSTSLLQEDEVILLYWGMEKFYLSTVGQWSLTSPSNHCRMAKLYSTTARQLIYMYQRNKLPLLH